MIYNFTPTLLDVQFFQIDDILVVPLCLLLLGIILRHRANSCKDNNIRKLYYQAFIFKIICVFAFTVISDFYFGGGDTGHVAGTAPF